MTRDDLLKALAERFPEKTLEDVTSVDGKPLFPNEGMLQEVITGSRDLDQFLDICRLREKFEELAGLLEKAATIAVYYQIPGSDFVRLAARAHQGATEYQQSTDKESN